MSDVAAVVSIGVPFTWLGMVVAISLLEAPLKFRAPGVTLVLGLGIGRLVFRALNTAEVVLAGLLAVVCAVSVHPGSGVWSLLAAAWAVLAVQLVGVRPGLSRRTAAVLDGRAAGGSSLHLVYIALEVVKIGVLVALGAALVEAALP